MPPVIIGVLMAAAYIASASAITIYTIAVAAIMVAASVASYALQGKSKAPGFSSLNSGAMVTSRDSIRPRDIVYGRMRKGGVVAFIGSYTVQKSNDGLALVICLAGHEIEAIEEVYFNDELAFDADGVAQGRFAGGQAAIGKHLGSADQTADATLMAYYPGIWTTDHRLRGIAYLTVFLAYNPDVYRGIPNVTAIVKGKKDIYDPRTSTTAWTDNPALCVADYLTDPVYGFGADAGAEIDQDALTAAANVCDELVDIPGSTTEKRYTANGILSSAEDPQTNLEMLLTSMAGRANYVGGEWIIRAGAYEAPTLTLDENDARGSLTVHARQQRRDVCNAVRGVMVVPDRDWQVTDFPPVVGTTFATLDNGEQIWRDVELPFTTSVTMAQRLAKIELYSTREEITVVYPCSLVALQLRAGDTVAVTNTRFGWTEKPFLVTDWRFSASSDSTGAPVLGCELSLRETSAAVYDYTASEQQLLAAAPQSQLASPFTITAPTIESLTPETALTSDGGVLHRMRVVFTPATDAFVASGGWVEVQYRVLGETDWLDAPSASPTGGVVVINTIEASTWYQIRLRFVNSLNVASAWTQVQASTDEYGVLPAAPSGLTASVGVGAGYLRWSNPASKNYAGTEIWISTTNNVATAFPPIAIIWGESCAIGGLTSSVEHYAWLRTVGVTSGYYSDFHPQQYNGVPFTPS